jgi:hypothetical protein
VPEGRRAHLYLLLLLLLLLGCHCRVDEFGHGECLIGWARILINLRVREWASEGGTVTMENKWSGCRVHKENNAACLFFILTC